MEINRHPQGLPRNPNTPRSSGMYWLNKAIARTQDARSSRIGAALGYATAPGLAGRANICCEEAREALQYARNIRLSHYRPFGPALPA
jgi:hypothetical protein